MPSVFHPCSGGGSAGSWGTDPILDLPTRNFRAERSGNRAFHEQPSRGLHPGEGAGPTWVQAPTPGRQKNAGLGRRRARESGDSLPRGGRGADRARGRPRSLPAAGPAAPPGPPASGPSAGTSVSPSEPARLRLRQRPPPAWPGPHRQARHDLDRAAVTEVPSGLR